MPKVDKTLNVNSEVETKESWKRFLLQMLKKSGFINITSLTHANLKLRNTTLLDIYIQEYLKEVTLLLRKGLRKQYRFVEDNTTALKGRLLFQKQIQKNLIHKERFYTSHQTYDKNHKLNQILLKALNILHDIAKPATKRFNTKKGWTFHGHEEIGKRMLLKIAKRMKISNDLRDYLMILTKLHLRPIALAKKEISDSAVRRVMYEAGEHVDDLMKLCRADITTKNPIKINKYMGNFERVEILMQDVKMKDEMKSFQSPVDGAKIMEVCSLKEGKVVGEIKKSIEDAILDETIPNTYEDAFNYMLKIKDNFIKN